MDNFQIQLDVSSMVLYVMDKKTGNKAWLQGWNDSNKSDNSHMCIRYFPKTHVTSPKQFKLAWSNTYQRAYVFDTKTGTKAWLYEWNRNQVDARSGIVENTLNIPEYYGCFSIVGQLPSWVPSGIDSMQYRTSNIKFFYCANCIKWTASHTHSTCPEQRSSPHAFFDRFKHDSHFSANIKQRVFQGSLCTFQGI